MTAPQDRQPATEATVAEFRKWLSGLAAVSVQWAPGHSAPYVSHDIVWSGTEPFIRRAAAEARAQLIAELREGLMGLSPNERFGIDNLPVSRAAVLALIEKVAGE